MSNCRRSTLLHRSSFNTVSFVQTPNRLTVKQISVLQEGNPEVQHSNATEGTGRLKQLLACRIPQLPTTAQTCKASQTTSMAINFEQATAKNSDGVNNKFNKLNQVQEGRLLHLANKKMLQSEHPPAAWKEVNIAHCSVGLSLLAGISKHTDAFSFLQCRVTPSKDTSEREEWIHNLVYLSLYFNIGKVSFRKCSFDGFLAGAVCNKLPNLFQLDLSLNKIGDEAAITIAGQLTKLRVLKLVDNALTDWSGVEIGSRLTDLQQLCLNNNSFGYVTANAIASNLLKLRYLYLPDNQITDRGCIEIAASLANIVKLWVRGNQLNGTTQLLTRSLLGCTADLVI